MSLAFSLRQTRVARAERSLAERRFQQVRKLAHTFLFDVHDAIAELPGSTKARSLVVTEGLAYLDSLAQEAGGDRDLKAELASAYMRVAEVQSGVGAANEGDSVSALASLRKAVALREELAVAYAREPGVRDDLAEAQIRMSGLLGKTGNLGEAVAWGRKAVANREAVLALNRSDLAAEARLGATQQRLAWPISASGRPVGGARASRAVRRASREGRPRSRSAGVDPAGGRLLVSGPGRDLGTDGRLRPGARNLREGAHRFGEHPRGGPAQHAGEAAARLHARRHQLQPPDARGDPARPRGAGTGASARRGARGRGRAQCTGEVRARDDAAPSRGDARRGGARHGGPRPASARRRRSSRR